MGSFMHDFFPAIFGALLLLCLCHSAKLGGLDERTSSSSNTSEPQRKARCFGSVKKWFGYGTEEILSGDPNDVRFFLYPNPLNKNYAEEIKYGNVEALKLSNFRPRVPLKIVIHGFTRNYVHEAIQMIKDAYLMRMQHIPMESSAVNVVLVDWEPLGNPKVEEGEALFYRLAVRNVPIVGRRVGEFVQFLMDNDVIESLRDVHIIGFSLGAHVAGNAGSTLRDLNAGRVPYRVTGLDPAGPAFYEKLRFSHRPLHKMDGRFVDVIHTNMGALGTLNVLGHADFYPNGGGPVQHYCEKEYEQKKKQNETGDGGIWDIKLLSVSSCSHNKAPEFFALSILHPNSMIACKCNDYQEFKSRNCACNETAFFGEYCDSKTRGTFYLDI